ncbi:Hypp1384 [Branchiostoma lanceolatum]|uniref:Hypp1384 protein n=1 Tax=Branchiostoma lanceolatum TaxID=7740 RepID=A0A8J9ZKJ0_BRALA|nr:Hypp1384 [Branchiostoma lanceolatum]
MEAPRPVLPNIARPKKLHRMSVTLDITAHFPSKDPQNTRKQSDMDRTYRKAIESVWPRLVRDLVLKPTFLQRLRTHGIFTQEVLNIIQNEPTPVLQKSLMLCSPVLLERAHPSPTEVPDVVFSCTARTSPPQSLRSLMLCSPVLLEGAHPSATEVPDNEPTPVLQKSPMLCSPVLLERAHPSAAEVPDVVFSCTNEPTPVLQKSLMLCSPVLLERAHPSATEVPDDVFSCTNEPTPVLQKSLMLCSPVLLERAHPSATEVPDDVFSCTNEPTPVLQKSLMLKLLMNRDSRQFHQFCQVLWDSGYHGLARALEDPQTDQREQAEALREEVTNLQQQNRLLTRRVRQLELDQQRTNKKLAEVTAELRSKDSRYTTQSSNEEDLLKKRNRTLRELLEMEEQYRRRMTKQRDGHV